MADIREWAESLLAGGIGPIDLNVLAETVLFTVPVGKECHITKIVMHSASGAIAAAKIQCGFNTGPANDVIANTGIITLSITDYYIIFHAQDNAKIGAAADDFSLQVETQEGAADTVLIDVFGYLY